MRTSFAIFVLSFGLATTTNAYDYHVDAAVEEDPTRVVDFGEFMQGVLMGAIESADPIAETCFLNGELMFLTIAEAVKDIREGTEEDTKAGIQLIGQIIEEAAKEVVDCEEAVNDFEALVQMANSFSNPWAFAFSAGKNIIINHVEIFQEVNDAMDEWEEPDYFQCGHNVGEALAQVFLLGSSEEATVSIQ
mmetsp:Transcript_6884/g.8922  ORF Transcript_6884/g.8922 Transcript_6884/m.8922 type:complete len:191 (+) Transcript_6884:93-665(+)|eukprot:CAMPEP_0198148390 /NCGR_PEP_ID=MMETSP1443-20131203/41154_1 /TAXON_ID=186043 /ORGANISM="Entomoneis sp., Strain CCMP2396" /LENGTH=190 /DNA_ID=CAMNT_0043813061 /DNA_START=73 /DNA_END=645 /DNA_ORIENTATION=+